MFADLPVRGAGRRWRVLAQVLAAAVIFAAALAPAQSWKEFRDTYGGLLLYPADIFTDHVSDRGVARFASAVGASLELSVDILSDRPSTIGGPAGRVAQYLGGQGLSITYRLVRDRFFVFSGLTADGKIVYIRGALSQTNDRIHQFVLVYPRERKSEFDPIVTRMSQTFSAN